MELVGAVYANDVEKIRILCKGVIVMHQPLINAIRQNATEEIAHILHDRSDEEGRRVIAMVSLSRFGPVDWVGPIDSLLPMVYSSDYICPATYDLLVTYYKGCDTMNDWLRYRPLRCLTKLTIIEACLPFAKDKPAIECFRYALAIGESQLMRKIHVCHKAAIEASNNMDRVAKWAYITRCWSDWMPKIADYSWGDTIVCSDKKPIASLHDAAFINTCHNGNRLRAEELMATGNVDFTAGDHMAFKSARGDCLDYLVTLCPRYYTLGSLAYVAEDVEKLDGWTKVRDGLFCNSDRPNYYGVKKWFDGLHN